MERPNARTFHSTDQKAQVMSTLGCWENIAALNIKKFSVYIPVLKTKILFDFKKLTKVQTLNYTTSHETSPLSGLIHKHNSRTQYQKNGINVNMSERFDCVFA